MLIEVHYGDGCILLVNGNCRSINLLNYIRLRCCLSSSIKIDLCLMNNGEPFHLSDHPTIDYDQRRHFPSHCRCVLTQIDEEGKYIPLLNDPTLITNEFLTKLKRATTKKVNPIKIHSKSKKASSNSSNEKGAKHRNLKSIAMLATLFNKSDH